MSLAENTDWKERYMQTILEVNGQKMPERITRRVQPSLDGYMIFNTTVTITRKDTK